MSTQKKLVFEALPKFAHGRNLRSAAPYAWKFVRAGILEKGCQCEICGATPQSEEDKRNFHAHEEWEFDLENHILILNRIGLICANCHQTDHMGLLEHKLKTGQISEEQYSEVFKHYARVNNCSVFEAKLDWMKSCLEYKVSQSKLDPGLKDANWTYRLDAEFPAKDKVVNTLLKKGLLTEHKKDDQ